MSTGLKIDTARFRTALLQRRSQVLPATQRAAERAKDEIVSAVQPLCRVKTGNEQAGWARDSYVEKSDGTKVTAVIRNTVSYAASLNYGTSRKSGTHELQIGMSLAAPKVREIFKEELERAFKRQG